MGSLLSYNCTTLRQILQPSAHLSTITSLLSRLLTYAVIG